MNKVNDERFGQNLVALPRAARPRPGAHPQ